MAKIQPLFLNLQLFLEICFSVFLNACIRTFALLLTPCDVFRIASAKVASFSGLASFISLYLQSFSELFYNTHVALLLHLKLFSAFFVGFAFQ